MTGLIARTSTIFIASGNGTHVYRSIADVPPPLRLQLQTSTTGINSATILIADRRGQEELIRAVQGEPSDVWSLLTGMKRKEKEIDTPPKHKRRRLPGLRTWLELFLPVLVGASLWLFIDSHF